MRQNIHDQPPSVTLKNLSLSYRQHPLFQDFSLDIPAGQWTCLLGPSGIGKSTLLRILANLPIETQNNQFSVSMEINGKTAATINTAYLAQQDMLLPWLTVLENVLIEHRLRHVDSKNLFDIKMRAYDLLKKAGLTKAIHYYPHQLSGGMRQRTALVRTLLSDHPLVLMDEPFSALDAITRFHLQNLASELLNHKTILLVTHDPLEAVRLADHIYILSNAPTRILSALEILHPKPRNLSHPDCIPIQTQLFQMLNHAYEAFYADNE